MEIIKPEFKDLDERNKVALISALNIVVPFIPVAVAFFYLRSSFSPAADAVIKSLLNFEILALICILVCQVPVFGWIVAPFLASATILAHFIVAIVALLGITNNQEIKIWAPIKFIQ